MRNKQMSGCVKCGKPTTALINYVMHASKKELQRMLISFITSEPTLIDFGGASSGDKPDFLMRPIATAQAQRPDVDNAHNIAAEMARQLDEEKRAFLIINKGQHDENLAQEKTIYADENGIFTLTDEELHDALEDEYDIGFADGQYNGKANMIRELSDRFPEQMADIYNNIYGEGDEQ